MSHLSRFVANSCGAAQTDRRMTLEYRDSDAETQNEQLFSTGTRDTLMSHDDRTAQLHIRLNKPEGFSSTVLHGSRDVQLGL